MSETAVLTLLERLRLDSDLTRAELADKSGVPVRTIRQLETGLTKRPGLRTLKPLADALGPDVAVSDLAADFRAERATA